MTTRPDNTSPPGGFTLVELVAVLVVIAMLAGAVAVSVRGHVCNAQLETFVDRLETFDGRARADARSRSQSVVFSFDLSEKRVSRMSAHHSLDSAARSFAVPLGVEIAEIRTFRQQSDHGVLQIAVSPRGQTDTYALQLRASSGRSVWLVVLGASGQCLRFEKEDDVEEIFSLQLGAAGSNAG